MSPGQVGCELNRTIIIIGIRSTDTHRLDGVNATHLLDDGLQSGNGSIDVCLGSGKAARLDGRSSLDFTTRINDSEHRIGSS